MKEKLVALEKKHFVVSNWSKSFSQLSLKYEFSGTTGGVLQVSAKWTILRNS